MQTWNFHFLWRHFMQEETKPVALNQVHRPHSFPRRCSLRPFPLTCYVSKSVYWYAFISPYSKRRFPELNCKRRKKSKVHLKKGRKYRKIKKVEKIESTEYRHSRANRFESCRMSPLDLTRRFTIPSTCRFNTGELWAKRLLDRFKVQNSLRQQSEYGAGQEQVQSVLSFQEAKF